jgi:membrane-anchored glycerophosphoryl diester phosphodiesterase (GDPDase)
VFERIRNSWELVKASAQVLWADKELIIFPIMSTIGLVLVSIAFVVPIVVSDLINQVTDNVVLSVIVLFLFYVAQYIVIFFSNSALVAAAMIRLRGGDPTVGDGFRAAFGHLPAILGYAVISATVGMILRWLSERGMLGQIASRLVGMAWNIATFLVVPILVMEGIGPVEAVKRSAGLLKKTWGEQIVGNLSIGLVFGLLIFLIILLGIGGVALGVNMESAPIAIAAAAVAVVLVLGLSLISSALSGIYSAAVYNYAVTGEPGTYFEQGLVEEAFRPKK